jgi:hypothetical protein
MSLDGTKYTTDETRPNQPLHGRCRCIYLPETKSWKELGFDVDEQAEMKSEYKRWTERDLKTRKVLDYGETGDNFEEFFHTKTETWQNNAYGIKRSDYIRSGELKMIDNVNKATGDLYTLNYLENKHDLSDDN